MQPVAHGETHPADTKPSERIASLLHDAASHAEELLKAEFALAKDELKTEIIALKKAAFVFGVAIVLGHAALFLLITALVLLLGGTAVAAAAVGAALLALAAIGFAIGKKLLAEPPLKQTRTQLAQDVHMLRERTNE